MPFELPDDYKNVFDYAAIGMAILSLDGRYLKVNKYFCEFYGYEPSEFFTMSFKDITYPEDLTIGTKELKKLQLGEIDSFHVEKRYIHKSGQIKWGLASISAVRDETGKSLYQIAQIQDISGRKLAEQNLSRRIEFERLVTAISTRFINIAVDEIDQEIAHALEAIGQFSGDDRIFIVQFYDDGKRYKKIIEWNPPGMMPFATVEQRLEAFPRWYSGISEEGSFYHEEMDNPSLDAYELRELFENPGAQTLINIPITQADQLVGFLGVSNGKLRNSFSEEDMRLLRVVGEVIFSALERKRSEYARRSSETLFAKAFNASPSLMLILTMGKMRILDVNDTFTETLGYSRNELKDKHLSNFATLIDGSDIETIHRNFRETGSVLNCEVNINTKSGKKRIGLLSAEVVQIENQTCILMVIQDITDKKHIEKEMERLERLNLIGEMAAGIGHEIRNPMTTVRGFLQIFSTREENSASRETFQLMIDELDRANQIITEFLSLSRDRTVDFKVVNINTIIHVLYPLIYAHANTEDKRVEIQLGEIPDSYVDEKELRQLILNLTRNGLEAMSAGGKLTISTYMKHGKIVLVVEDQGCGIPSEIREKIGTPFFTTKENGTGLGMAICYSIAARHKATIDFQSNPTGTKVFVKFKKINASLLEREKSS